MPAGSQSQRRAAGMALAAKRGEISPKALKGAARSMYKSMTMRELEKYASGSEARLPKRVPGKKKRKKHKKKGR